MTTVEYLEEVLKEQSLSGVSSELKKLRDHRKDVESLLKSSFDESKPKIQYGGSYSKGTMIKEHYDLDIISYFPHDSTSAGETLKEIYDNVASALEDEYYVERKKSALRLRGKGDDDFKVDFHIDVVPGRYTDEKNEDVFIFQQGAEKERLKTNLEKHISHIHDSGLTQAIRLLKLWNIRRSLGVKTFILELMVVKVLSKHKNKSLDKQLVVFWEHLVDVQGNEVVEDPANPSGNDLSEFNNAGQQLMLASTSQSTLDSIKNAGWESVFGELSETDKSELFASITATNTDRVKPWGNK